MKRRLRPPFKQERVAISTGQLLASSEAVPVIDETGFLKQGQATWGAVRQYAGSAGKIANCRIDVFAAYVLRQGRTFMNRMLYLPKGWIDAPERMMKAYALSTVGFAARSKGYVSGCGFRHPFRSWAEA